MFLAAGLKNNIWELNLSVSLPKKKKNLKKNEDFRSDPSLPTDVAPAGVGRARRRRGQLLRPDPGAHRQAGGET